MAAADVLVQPYLGGEEPSGADGLLLGMSCGKPVVATAGGPAADLVGPGAGYLVAAHWGRCGGEEEEEEEAEEEAERGPSGGEAPAGEATEGGSFVGSALLLAGLDEEEEAAWGRHRPPLSIDPAGRGAGHVQLGLQHAQHAQHASGSAGYRSEAAGSEDCLRVDPTALAVALQRAHGSAEGRAAKGAAAAEAARALAARRSWDAVAASAWARVEARLRQAGTAATRRQQHRRAGQPWR